MKDFVGARLEAEQTLRKQRTASLLDGAVGQSDTTEQLTASGRGHPNLHRPEQQQQQHPQADGKRQETSGDLDTPQTSTLGAANGPNSAEVPAPNPGCGKSTPDGGQQPQEKATMLLTELHRREQELPSAVAVLDDRMTRARPMGPLAKSSSSTASVSTSAEVFDSSPLTAAAKQGPHGTHSDPIGTHVGEFCARFGATSVAAVAASPGRFSNGQRRRRMSAPLLLPLAAGVRGVGCRDGEKEAQKTRRPWTTANGEREAVISREEHDGERREGGIDVRPFR